MFNLLCKTFNQFISSPLVIVGLALISVGIAMGLLARRITCAVRHSNKIESNDTVFVTIKVAGLLLVAVGFVLVAINVVIALA